MIESRRPKVLIALLMMAAAGGLMAAVASFFSYQATHQATKADVDKAAKLSAQAVALSEQNRKGVQCITERLSELGVRLRITSGQAAKGLHYTVKIPPELEPDVIPNDLLHACDGFLSGIRINVDELLKELQAGESITTAPAAHPVARPTPTTAPKRTTTTQRRPPATTTTTTRPPPPPTTEPCTLPAPALCGLPVDGP